jgi:hypothetical protein
MTASRVRIRALDIVIFLIALILIGIISLRAYGRGRGAPEITISGADAQWIYPLDGETTLHVPGPLGETVVVIEEDTVRVISSPCPEKICIKTGRISKPGQWIACLPNRVLISIRARTREQPDAISQ